MEASDLESIGCGNVKPELPQHPSEEPQENHSNLSSDKQNSVFSLTIDEFQYKSGRSFGSMNMDELLNSVWNVDVNQVSSNSNQNEPNNDENIAATPINFPRQGSFSIPTPLCNKTIEEVWAEIQRNQSPQQNHNLISNDVCERQHTFGEITLEDFLMKVGVIQEASSLSTQPRIQDSFQNHCVNFPSNEACLDPSIGPGPMMGLEYPNPNGENNFQGNGSPMYQVFTPSGGFVGECNTISGNQKCNGVEGEQHTKRRTTNGSMELAVERRQRRMIKNRESAARSRARKQAYTAELEIELNELREENARLKLILAEAQNKRKQEVLKGKPSAKVQRTSEKFKTLRRTSSSAW